MPFVHNGLGLDQRLEQGGLFCILCFEQGGAVAAGSNVEKDLASAACMSAKSYVAWSCWCLVVRHFSIALVVGGILTRRL